MYETEYHINPKYSVTSHSSTPKIQVLCGKVAVKNWFVIETTANTLAN